MSCVLSGEPATGYIEIDNEMVPCYLKILGPASVGEMAEVPEEYHEKLKNLISQQG